MAVKLMVTLSGPFEGGDPGNGERRTFTVGDDDPAALVKRVVEGVAVNAERMLRLEDVPVSLWDSLECAD